VSAIAYPALAIFGILLTSYFWGRLTARPDFNSDRRLPMIYLCGLIAAFLGAKIVYLAAEGWLLLPRYADNPTLVWQAWFTGKTITGALLGGYLGVELGKKMLGYQRPTGDLFAVLVPIGLSLGRVGCWIRGCCLGVEMHPHWWTLADVNGTPRWPSVQVELAFNILFFFFALTCWRRRAFEGQVFHLYLIAYAIFRFAHEFLRDTPNIVGAISGYQIATVAIFTLGVVRYWQRAKTRSAMNLTMAVANGRT
jgi:phosphatidylglycerol:prolipoprotein diacylglycerol transferase